MTNEEFSTNFCKKHEPSVQVNTLICSHISCSECSFRTTLCEPFVINECDLEHLKRLKLEFFI